MSSLRAGAFAAILAGALVFAAWGITSLALDRDVVAERGVSRFLQPAMLAAAVVVIGVASGIEWAWTRRERRIAWGRIVLWAVAAWIVFAVVAAVGASAGGVSASVGTPIGFAWHHASGPFAIAVPLAAVGCVAGTAVLARRETGPDGAPLDRKTPSG